MIRDEGRAANSEFRAMHHFRSLNLLVSIPCCRACPLSLRFGFHSEFRFRASVLFP